MKLLNGIRTMLGSALVAASLMFAAAAPANAQYVVTPAQPAYVQGPGCPVAPYDLRNVLSGYYGVDGLQRPLNAQGFPVDVYGNCLTQAPVTEVFNYSPSPFYINFLWLHFGYRYYYQPGFVHLWSGPGVYVNRGYGAIPYGHNRVIIQQNYHAPLVTVHPGATTTVRPGYNGGVTTTVRPGAPAVTAPPAYVTPPRAAAPTTTFNRPTSGFSRPAAPTGSFTPPRSSGGSSIFRRPGH
ncbi:MAG: hypothetical protein KGS72_24910 [Cyanobacteria bacterium REEB67]|nr:hypothetical protein [Cyanobacteria bacterium REEB67]